MMTQTRAQDTSRKETAERMMQLILGSIKPEDIYLRGFLKPVFIALKTTTKSRQPPSNPLKLNNCNQPILEESRENSLSSRDNLSKKPEPDNLRQMDSKSCLAQQQEGPPSKQSPEVNINPVVQQNNSCQKPAVGSVNIQQTPVVKQVQVDQILKDKENQGRVSGLQIVKEHNINKVEQIDFIPTAEAKNINQLQVSCSGNLLSLLKGSNGIKLAICITVRDQDKGDLKRTLDGVRQNISKLVTSNNVQPDDIAVVVVIDGMKQAHALLADFHEECERASGIQLGNNSIMAYDIHSIQKATKQKTQEEIWEEELRNNTLYIFSAAELKERIDLRFQQVKKRYKQAVDILQFIQKFTGNKLTYDDLPLDLQEWFVNQAKLYFSRYIQQQTSPQKQMEWWLQLNKKRFLKKAKQKFLKVNSKEGNMDRERACEEYIKSLQGQLDKELERAEPRLQVYKKEIIYYRLSQRSNRDKVMKEKFGSGEQLNLYLSLEKKCQDIQSKENILKLAQVNINETRHIINQVLIKAKKHYTNFVNTKQRHAYLAYFRREINIQHFQANYSQQTNLHQESSDHVSMNLFLCTKYQRTGVQDSHNWFFNGFCKELNPKYAVVLQAGVKPASDAIFKIYQYLNLYPDVGAVTGAVKIREKVLADMPEQQTQHLGCLIKAISSMFDVQRAQQMEANLGTITGCFQSPFGFTQSIPAYFSAFNLGSLSEKLKHADTTSFDELLKFYLSSSGPVKVQSTIITSIGLKKALLLVLLPDCLNKLFIQVDSYSDEALLYELSFRQASSKIMPLGLYHLDFETAFLPDAQVQISPSKTMHELIDARKDQINSRDHAYNKIQQEKSSKNNTELYVSLQMFYLFCMKSLLYFAPSLFLFLVHICLDAFRRDVLATFLNQLITGSQNHQLYKSFVYTVDFIYVTALLSLILFSLHFNHSELRFRPYLYGITTFLGVLALIVSIVLLVDVIRGLLYGSTFLTASTNNMDGIPSGLETINILRYILICSLGVFLLAIIVYFLLFAHKGFIFEFIFSIPSSIFHAPAYMIVFELFALSRMDELLIPGKNSSRKVAGIKETWRFLKFLKVGKYVSWNGVVGTVIITIAGDRTYLFFMSLSLAVVFCFFFSIKIMIAIIYMLTYRCKSSRLSQVQRNNITSRVDETVDKYKSQIIQEIKKILEKYKEEYLNNSNISSLLQVSRTKAMIDRSMKAFKQQSAEQSRIRQNNRQLSNKFTSTKRDGSNLAPSGNKNQVQQTQSRVVSQFHLIPIPIEPTNKGRQPEQQNEPQIHEILETQRQNINSQQPQMDGSKRYIRLNQKKTKQSKTKNTTNNS